VGIILDSSAIIAAERRGLSVLEMLLQIRASQGEVAVGISVVSVAELVHGAYRAPTDERKRRRLQFIERLAADLPVYPVTAEVAYIAGRIEGELAAKGVQIAFEDLLIGATALQLGYGVATLNPRHFQVIPGLNIVKI
jgi:predicted nucleic acid-binding protein